ncbi:MAG: chloramphenicol phosphotransferase CPT family protein [Acidimicrobiales bacterium]|jgi:chloramphenicol 3-O phosphotransferase
MVTGGDSHPGRVMILNGGSSAGKTTLGRGLQSALSDTWLLLGIDLLIWTLPPRMVNDAKGLTVHEGVIVRGDLFMSLYAGFQSAVATLARSGVNVLLDDLTLDGIADQQRWSDALQGLDVLWVGVRCAPPIAAERESRRQSRLPGIARHQAESVHVGVRYDVEVDTGVLDLRESMSLIAESMGRRWSIPVPVLSNHPSTLPPTSAWSPGDPITAAPWER